MNIKPNKQGKRLINKHWKRLAVGSRKSKKKLMGTKDYLTPYAVKLLLTIELRERQILYMLHGDEKYLDSYTGDNK